ncbi:nucleotidyltransferase family protein [Paenibacillus sp. DMB20]|uniref:nucleotidyltransferase family protein n=1 Tax=Paenibacillus sp. DMB20 TaxID=1642570 RepID=UPI000627C927|nr:nucleotidyltransferase family protein [Paenibacillus sp. DMB20]KKO53463.1 hypothetical protein XI25_12745 [Paenibacillus sp. DMB20]
MSLIVRHLSKTNINYALLRGFGFQSYYPTGYNRQFNDIDIIVKTIEDFNNIMDLLLGLEYFIAKPMVIRKQKSKFDNDSVWIGVALNKRTDKLDHPIMVDITLGGPSISHQSHYPLDERSWNSLQFIEIGNVSVPILSDTDNFLLLLCESYERNSLYIRDLLDMEQIIQANIDIHRVKDKLKKLELFGQVQQFRQYAEKINLTNILSFLDSLQDQSAFSNHKSKQTLHIKKVMKYRPFLNRIVGIYFEPLVSRMEQFENKYPEKAMNIYSRVPLNFIFNIGWPLYLFPESRKEQLFSSPPMFIRDKQEGNWRTNLKLGSFVTRIRPVTYIDEWVLDHDNSNSSFH